MGKTLTNENPTPGHPLTQINDDKIDEVCTIIREDHRLTVHEIAEELYVSVGSCHEILTGHLNMHRISQNSCRVCCPIMRKRIALTSIKNCLTVPVLMKTSSKTL